MGQVQNPPANCGTDEFLEILAKYLMYPMA